MSCLYMYRMTADTGFAPCPDKGLLTLACCKGGQLRNGKTVKTGLRHTIGTKYKDADLEKDKAYILGTLKDKFLYLARVTNVVTMKEYFCGRSKGRTDDIYSLAGGELVRNNNLRFDEKDVHTEPGRNLRDLAGEYVIMSRDFIYLGKDAVFDKTIAEYNPKFQETKTYTGADAEKIIKACEKYRDGKKHTPTNPFENKGGCR